MSLSDGARELIARTETGMREYPEVQVYLNGLVNCSVCVPAEWDAEQVAVAVNTANPAGTQHGWKISDAETFSGGEPMPCECNQDPSRRHWLLEC